RPFRSDGARPRRLDGRGLRLSRFHRPWPSRERRPRRAGGSAHRRLGRRRLCLDALGPRDAIEPAGSGARPFRVGACRARGAASAAHAPRLGRARPRHRSGLAAPRGDGERAAKPARYLAQSFAQRGLSLRSRFFPADARPGAHSFIAGAPYNMQLAAFVASLVTPRFPPAAMINLNLLFQLAAGLLLARLAAAGGREDATLSWSGTALGILLATLLNPGFDPRYHLSAYSEPSVTVTLAFAGWFAARGLDRMNGGRRAGFDVWMLALALVALVNIKQESVLLVAGIVIAALALAAAGRAQRARAVAALILAAVPAAALYLLWRWYVLAHFEIGELKNLPVSQWHVAELPQILSNMLLAITNKGVFFAILFLVIAIAIARGMARRFDGSTRIGLMLAGTTLVYNLGLIAAYVAHFEGEMGIGAHSYFRYSTHLSLLLMAAIASMLHGWSPPRLVPGWRRALPALAVALVLLDPIPFARLLRFDLEIPNLRVWRIAR